MGFINEDSRPGELMQFPERRRICPGKRFKELHGSRNDDRSVPQERVLSGLDAVKLGSMVMSRHHVIPLLTFKNQGLAVCLHGLVDDIRVWQHHKDATQPLLSGCIQKMRHHGRCLAGSHGAIAGQHASGRVCIQRGIKHGLPNTRPFVCLTLRKAIDIPPQAIKALACLQRQAIRRFYSHLVPC